MDFNKVCIFGDSFTWGEGLELYINDTKWINQRNKKSEWHDLRPLMDDESIRFRESNRYPNLVANHFNKELITDPNNGGSIQSLFRNLYYLINNNISNSIIILQFSAFSRNLIHSHQVFDENLDCPCEFCMSEGAYKSAMNFHDVFTLLEHGLDGSKKYELLKKYLEDEHDIDFNNRFVALNKLRKLENEYYLLHLNALHENFCKPLEKLNNKFYFIDTWEQFTSEIIFKNQYIVDRLIPLIGPNDKYYLKYYEWQDTFEHTSIEHEFIGSLNHHPTLLQHQYLAKSVINHIENINKIII